MGDGSSHLCNQVANGVAVAIETGGPGDPSAHSFVNNRLDCRVVPLAEKYDIILGTIFLHLSARLWKATAGVIRVYSRLLVRGL